MGSVCWSGGSRMNDPDAFRSVLIADLVRLVGADRSQLVELDINTLQELKNDALRALMEEVA